MHRKNARTAHLLVLFLALEGDGLTDELIQALDPFETGHQVVSI